jgi:predicted metalloprotease with PDZ domain
VDYYSEGALIWLDVDATLRRLSNGKRSLNAFCARFLGKGGNTAAKVLPYSFDDIFAELNAVQPFDWERFLQARVKSNSTHAPLGGITEGGYKLQYTPEANEYTRAEESHDRGVDAWYSLGFRTSDQSIRDVLVNSIAYKAGLGPDMKLLAVNGRHATDELLHNAIRDSKTSTEPIELIVENAGFFKVVKLDYHSGERYPHLVREDKATGYLDDILKPMVRRAGNKTI